MASLPAGNQVLFGDQWLSYFSYNTAKWDHWSECDVPYLEIKVVKVLIFSPKTWFDNMGRAGESKIKPFDGDDYTCITFQPDLAKFKMQALDKDTVALLTRRAYDIAGSTKGVRVFLNGKKLPVSRWLGFALDPIHFSVVCLYHCIFPSKFKFLYLSGEWFP